MKKSVKATVCVMAAATAITAIPMVSAQAADEKVTVNFWHSMGGDNEKILQSGSSIHIMLHRIRLR